MFNLKQIHKDDRGEIYIIEGDLKEHKEIALLFTKKSFARGGCVHNLNDEHLTVLEGKIHFFTKDKEFILEKGKSITTIRNTPHYFISLEDSLVMEWGCVPEEKAEKYKPLRDIVDKINRNHD